MATLADEFRAEARSQPGHVAKRKIGGWSFCLSYGAVDAQEAVAVALDTGLRVSVQGREDVTEQVIERLQAVTPEEQALAQEALAGEWMLTVKVFPPGRVATDKDLVFLGRTLVALHVPDGAAQPPAVLGTRQWIWRDS